MECCFTLITFSILGIYNLSINCHAYLNLVSRDLFLGLKGVLPLWYLLDR